MEFIENGTTGHRAIALVSIRTRKTGDSNKQRVVRKGEIGRICLVSAVDGMKAARRDLLAAITDKSSWARNWRIAEGTATF